MALGAAAPIGAVAPDLVDVPAAALVGAIAVVLDLGAAAGVGAVAVVLALGATGGVGATHLDKSDFLWLSPHH